MDGKISMGVVEGEEEDHLVLIRLTMVEKVGVQATTRGLISMGTSEISIRDTLTKDMTVDMVTGAIKVTANRITIGRIMVEADTTVAAGGTSSSEGMME
jgi:hypothetical protein